MSNARNSTIATCLALRLDGLIQARRLAQCHGETWPSSFDRERRRLNLRFIGFAEDIDALYHELKSLGANIVETLEKKPWGLRQFTVEDLDGNRFYFHHD